MTTTFLCSYRITDDGTRDWIATREYFPRRILASIRQKTRWTLGIAFQGCKNLGWQGKLAQRYFLFRDRKGPLCHVLVALSGIALILYLISDVEFPVVGAGLLLVNSVLMLNRAFQRMAHVRLVHGWGPALTVPLRLPIAHVVNAAAALGATYQFLRDAALGIAPAWSKTDHELPAGFGAAEPEHLGLVRASEGDGSRTGAVTPQDRGTAVGMG